jgi:hypothetical protein
MKKYVKSLTLLIALSLCQLAVAQRRSFTPEHEFRLGIGAYPLAESIDYSFNYSDSYNHEYSGNNPYESKQNYHGASIFTGSISAGYTYNILRWLAIGSTLTYAGDFQKRYDRISNEEKGTNRTNRLYLTPMVRFNYLNRPIVRLYSQMGVGISYVHTKQHFGENPYSSSDCGLSAHVTFFGISVGRQLFGFAELLSVGVQGSFVVGMGYKFNAKKR